MHQFLTFDPFRRFTLESSCSRSRTLCNFCNQRDRVLTGLYEEYKRGWRLGIWFHSESNPTIETYSENDSNHQSANIDLEIFTDIEVEYSITQCNSTSTLRGPNNLQNKDGRFKLEKSGANQKKCFTANLKTGRDMDLYSPSTGCVAWTVNE